jgi:Asparagine synthase
VNLFVVGFDPAGVRVEAMERSLRTLADRVPFLDPSAIRSRRTGDGRAAAVWLCDVGAAVNGIEYVHADAQALALFAGRPIGWSSDRADGRGTLDPRSYLPPAAEWANRLDGRFVAIRYEQQDGRLEVVTDPMGAYPVYTTETGSSRFVSNRPALLAALMRREEQDEVAIAHFLASGWALGGGCLWKNVRRLERGHVHRFDDRGASIEQLDHVDTPSLVGLYGSGLDPAAAARILVKSVRAAADWAGRPSVVFLSGGLDSRLVFAAAVASGIDFAARTVAFPDQLGYPDTGDVVIGRRLAAGHGIPHTVVSRDSPEGVRTDARLMRLLTNGLVSIGDTGPLRPPPADGPLELVHSGMGGEISRTFYGIGAPTTAELLEQILRHVVPRWPRPLISADGEELVRSFVRDWIDRQLGLGARPADVTDLFYLLERMPNWVAPSQMYYEQRNDTISPLWFARLVQYQVSPQAADRERALFHFELLSTLAPDLARQDFDGTNPPWPVFGRHKAGRVHHAQAVANKALREARRRVRARIHRSADMAADPFVTAMVEARRGVAASADHPVWRYLDPGRVQSLLGTHPLRLDPRSRRAVWRLASVFAADEHA